MNSFNLVFHGPIFFVNINFRQLLIEKGISSNSSIVSVSYYFFSSLLVISLLIYLELTPVKKVVILLVLYAIPFGIVNWNLYIKCGVAIKTKQIKQFS